MYAIRTAQKAVNRMSRHFPVVLVTGARQVGKTTLLRQLSGEERGYVTLDDPLLLSLAREDPPLFMQRFPPPLLIDEIQYAPQLLPCIKMAVDEQRHPGAYWLTGSQQFHLMRGVSESLAGRVGVLHLLGLSRRERVGAGEDADPFLPGIGVVAGAKPVQVNDLYALIWRGSYPAMALNAEMDRDLFFASYVQTYLQRDVRDLANVGNEATFLRFLRAAAARSGQLLNLSELARDADVSPNTAKSWLSILQASGVAYLLEPYHTNVTKRLVKTPKLYFLDTGLCAYLTEWATPATLASGAMSGAILETWILGELLKSYWHNGRRAPFYFYRDSDMKEIDLLIIQDGTIFPLEFKKTASPKRDDAAGFRLLDKLGLPIGAGAVVCLVDKMVPLTATATAVPAALL